MKPDTGSGKPVLHRAAWVVPVVSSPIQDGAVLVHGNDILAVGRHQDFSDAAITVVEHSGVITPALINCHAHLELSVHADCADRWKQLGVPGDMPGWIRTLLAGRIAEPSPAEIVARAEQTLADLERAGTGLLIDIGNRPWMGQAEGDTNCRCQVLFLQEFLGFSELAAQGIIASFAEHDDGMPATGHAPYSTHPELLRFLKQRAVRRGELFSIHLAESQAEVSFLTNGRGAFHEFLSERGVLDPGFQAPGVRPVSYLHSLGLLDEKTLCVHCVQVDDGEIALLAATGARVCLCPGSNRLLGVGVAPLEQMLAQHILPGLGTDSLASNESLNLWREMRLLAEDHPSVALETLFAMATMAGAAMVSQEKRLGGIAPGMNAGLLHVEMTATSQQELMEGLIFSGEQATVRWIDARE